MNYRHYANLEGSYPGEPHYDGEPEEDPEMVSLEGYQPVSEPMSLEAFEAREDVNHD